MISSTKFQVRDSNGPVKTCDTLRDAVLAAAKEDGYGAIYQRDADGAMRLYSSRVHIGNNSYFPKSNEAFSAMSVLEDDDAAEIEVAAQVYKTGVYHSKHNLEIVQLTFLNGSLSAIDGKPIEQVAEEWDISTDDVRGIYQ